MKVAMVVSEAVPFAKTGGLADVAGALPDALSRLGAEVDLFLPRYACVKETGPQINPGTGVTVRFIDAPHYFGRTGLYGNGHGDYPDNLQRFSFFCQEAIRLLKSSGTAPDILHAHDWQAALSVVYLTHSKKGNPFFRKTQSVFTIHNMAYQGIFPKDQYPQLQLPWELFTMEGLEYYDRINLLKGGLIFADRLTTVSPTYAKEIQDPSSGEGLDGVLRRRSANLSGIINGIDLEFWNPATDSHLLYRFSASDLAPKGKGKAQLQKEMGLSVDPKAFLIGMVTRIASQKGLDLLVEALPVLAREHLQLAILGRGDRPIEESLKKAAAQMPNVRVQLAFDEGLAHRIYAGSDAFLMPSRYEPCGLGQMIAMRYGTVPIVRATGGLLDTVREGGSDANGFLFLDYKEEALAEAIGKAQAAFRNRSQWEAICTRGMEADFSWDHSAKEYLRLYEGVIATQSEAKGKQSRL